MTKGRRARLGAGAILALWLSLGLSTGARAQTLEAARSLYLEAEFEAAVTSFEALLDSAELAPGDAAEAHRYLSALLVMLGQAERGQTHALAALALSPTSTPPEGVPPEVEETFATARATLAGQRASLDVTPSGTLARGSTAELSATLVPETLPRIAELSLRCSAGGEPTEERGPPPTIRARVAVEADAVECHASALNAAGGAVLTSSASLVAVPGEGGGDDVLIYSLVGAGAAVLLAGVIVAVVLATGGGSDQAALGSPRVVGW